MYVCVYMYKYMCLNIYIYIYVYEYLRCRGASPVHLSCKTRTWVSTLILIHPWVARRSCEGAWGRGTSLTLGLSVGRCSPCVHLRHLAQWLMVCTWIRFGVELSCQARADMWLRFELALGICFEDFVAVAWVSRALQNQHTWHPSHATNA